MRAVLTRLGRGARRLRVLGMAALLLVAAVAGVAVWRLDRPRPADLSGGGGDVVRVGVAQGSSIPAYVAASRAELATLPAGSETYALVALREYLPPDRLAPVLAGVALSVVYARVPLPGQQTEIVRIPANQVPVDVIRGMDKVADRKDGYARSGDALARAEASGYREHCSCVYAAVIRATPGALAQVAKRDEVRVVDAAPEVRRIDRAVFLPPLPEQSDQARPPDTASPSGRAR
jgi:hypothetical protein